jgi:hypothetical protein
MSIVTRDIIDDAMAAAKLSLDSVYTVWSENTAYTSDILFKRNAISFDPSINLSNNAGKSSSPAIAVYENNVYLVWNNDTSGNSEILYRRSTNGGASFGGTVNLSNTTENSSRATVAVTMTNVPQQPQQDVYIVWIDDDVYGGGKILYRKSTDGGASFGGIVNMYINLSWRAAAVAASGNNVYLVWNNDTSGNSEILYRKSTNGGAFFGGTVNLSNTAEHSYSTRVAASNNLSL